jgi:hypothetical protein
MLTAEKLTELRGLVSLAETIARRDASALRLAERDCERQAAEIEALRHKPTRSPAKPKPQLAAPCGKRWYRSEAAAREASRTLGHTVRTYRCPDCSTDHQPIYHITKRDFA